MTKITKLLPIGLFFAYAVKLMIVPVDLTDGLILAVLATLAGYFEFRSEKETIKALEDKITNNFKELDQKIKDLEDIRSTLTAIKLGQSIKTNNFKINS